MLRRGFSPYFFLADLSIDISVGLGKYHGNGNEGQIKKKRKDREKVREDSGNRNLCQCRLEGREKAMSNVACFRCYEEHICCKHHIKRKKKKKNDSNEIRVGIKGLEDSR